MKERGVGDKAGCFDENLLAITSIYILVHGFLLMLFRTLVSGLLHLVV